MEHIDKEEFKMERTQLNFGDAIAILKTGGKVQRKGWNGKEMWLILIENWTVGYEYVKSVDGLLPVPFIAMKTANSDFVPWLASQTDMLAEDWEVV
jgi:hypothetical protein